MYEFKGYKVSFNGSDIEGIAIDKNSYQGLTVNT